MEEVNITIIGAGVIGLACAYLLSEEFTDIAVIEKNSSFGQETSSRNSEVIHAGIYYSVGSLKAVTSKRGSELLYEMCSKNNIPHRKTGKLITALNEEDFKQIEKIYVNARQCGIERVHIISRQEIKVMEPLIEAEKALFVEDTGIVDTHRLMDFLYHKSKSAGVICSFSTEVTDIKKISSGYEVSLCEPSGDSSGDRFSFHSRVVINAAGLFSDKIAEKAGIDIDENGYKLYYCKGQYFRIRNPEKFSIKHLVYPPPTEVSLGIHITPDMGGGLRLGPDASYISEIDYTVDEGAKKHFWESVSKFLPSLKEEDLILDTAGVRSKLQPEHGPFRDFIIKDEEEKGLPGFINLIGIESPGLTSCLAIAEMVRDFVRRRL